MLTWKLVFLCKQPTVASLASSGGSSNFCDTHQLYGYSANHREPIERERKKVVAIVWNDEKYE